MPLNQHNTTTTDLSVKPKGSNNNNKRSKKEPHYQRRNIDFVKYKDEYVYHEDMDDELSILHSPPNEMIANGKTWIIKKFGVFRGLDNIDSTYPQRKRRKRAANEPTPTNKQPANNKKKPTTQQIQTKEPPSIISSPSPMTDIPMNFPGYENISSELRDDFLLSAFAQQGTTFGTSQIDSINNNLSHLLNQNSTPVEQINNSPSSASESNINQLLRYLFQSNGNSTNGSTPTTTPAPVPTTNNNTTMSSRHQSETPVPITHLFSNKKDSIPLNDKVQLDSPLNDSHMPKTIIQLVPSILDDSTLLQSLQQIDPLLKIPQTGVLVHGLTRFLLNHYINNVADLMTVIPVENNPWKSLYFPRALAALGDLTGLGYTSNSRNSLLNALLAVSCFHIKSKFIKNSILQKFFVNLGIEFRCQASGFLKKCLNETVDNERYKDVVTAILSMNSIDVVWGTMTDCQRHLTICEDFIERRMKSRPKLSKKAKILHRIFSFLKLIQDSTALDKVRDKEIVFSTKPSTTITTTTNNTTITTTTTSNISEIDPLQDQNKQITNQPIRDAPTTTGLFRESVNEKDGKIQIEYIKEDDLDMLNSLYPNTTTTNTTTNNNKLTPPMFSNIASLSYYPSDSSNPNSAMMSPLPIIANSPTPSVASSTRTTQNNNNSSSNVPGTDALYGLPNSLILLFSDCVRIARHTEYYNMKYISIPRDFTNLTIRFEKRLLKWKSEWIFYKDDNKKEFISDTVEALYHHTMSFYFGLVIYYFTMARSLNNDFLQNYVSKVLKHLKLMTNVIKDKNIQLVPLMWQGFIAGCSATEEDTEEEFKEWAADLAGSGMGSYWGARQVMYEVWKRRKNEEPGDNWFAVYKDWEMNLMLS